MDWAEKAKLLDNALLSSSIFTKVLSAPCQSTPPTNKKEVPQSSAVVFELLLRKLEEFNPKKRIVGFNADVEGKARVDIAAGSVRDLSLYGVTPASTYLRLLTAVGHTLKWGERVDDKKELFSGRKHEEVGGGGDNDDSDSSSGSGDNGDSGGGGSGGGGGTTRAHQQQQCQQQQGQQQQQQQQQRRLWCVTLGCSVGWTCAYSAFLSGMPSRGCDLVRSRVEFGEMALVEAQSQLQSKMVRLHQHWKNEESEENEEGLKEKEKEKVQAAGSATGDVGSGGAPSLQGRSADQEKGAHKDIISEENEPSSSSSSSFVPLELRVEVWPCCWIRLSLLSSFECVSIGSFARTPRCVPCTMPPWCLRSRPSATRKCGLASGSTSRPLRRLAAR
jgi:hypothetical protein